MNLPAAPGQRPLGRKHLAPVPLFIAARNLPRSFKDRIEWLWAGRIPAGTSNRMPSWMRQLLRNGGLYIVVDGLDELVSDDRADTVTSFRGIMDRFPACSYLFTARNGSLNAQAEALLACKKGTLRSLTLTQCYDFVARWFESDSIIRGELGAWRGSRDHRRHEFISIVSSQKELAEMASSPLLLTFMLAVYVLEGRLPLTRRNLIERAISLCTRLWDQRREWPLERSMMCL
jgi:hypothetical protein